MTLCDPSAELGCARHLRPVFLKRLGWPCLWERVVCWAVLRRGYCLAVGVRYLGIPWNPSISPQAACECVNVCVSQYLGVRSVHGGVCACIHMDTWGECCRCPRCPGMLGRMSHGASCHVEPLGAPPVAVLPVSVHMWHPWAALQCPKEAGLPCAPITLCLPSLLEAVGFRKGGLPLLCPAVSPALRQGNSWGPLNKYNFPLPSRGHPWA